MERLLSNLQQLLDIWVTIMHAKYHNNRKISFGVINNFSFFKKFDCARKYWSNSIF